MTPPPRLVLLKCRKSSGRPIIFPSQFITIISSSVQAGDEAFIQNKFRFKILNYVLPVDRFQEFLPM